MSDDPFDNEEWRAYAQHARDELLPMLQDVKFVMSIVSDAEQPDIKFCLELGAAIMLEKPIIAIVTRGVKVPDMLRQIAFRVVEIDLDDDGPQGSVERTRTAIFDLLAELKVDMDEVGDDVESSDD